MSTSSSCKIVVSAELHGCGVYLANERLTCSITFTNTGPAAETLAWAGAQIHCQACAREDIVQLDVLQSAGRSRTSTETAFVPNRGAWQDFEERILMHIICKYRRERYHCVFNPNHGALL